MKQPKIRCRNCGREGLRGFTYTVRGVYVCSNKNACTLRQTKPVWRVNRR